MQKLIIRQDELAASPRDWDNLGTMVCFHLRYDLGDNHKGDDGNLVTPEDLLQFIKEENPIRLPLYLLDHSGLWLRTGKFMEDPQGWDTSMVGFIYVTREKIKAEFGWTRLTKTRREKILSILEAEVSTYSQYLEGDVWSFSIQEETTCPHCGQPVTEVLDSCGGFYGSDPETNGMADHIPNLADLEVCYE